MCGFSLEEVTILPGWYEFVTALPLTIFFTHLWLTFYRISPRTIEAFLVKVPVPIHTNR